MTANTENVLSGPEQYSPVAHVSAAPRSVSSWLRRISLNDWIVFAYLGALNLAILASNGHGPERDQAIMQMSGLLLVFSVVVLVLIRGGILTHPLLTPLAFRLSHYGGIQLTYFFMRGFLPIVNPGSL